jgi:uncharacterized OB-fold protein
MIAAERCPRCARHALPGRGFCPRCGGRVQTVELPGDGVILSAATPHRAPLPSPVGVTPFAVALLRLDAAPEITLMAVAPEAPRIGARMRARPLEEQGRAPYGLEPA